MNEILEILEKDARVTPDEIARMLKMKASAVKSEIKKLEKDFGFSHLFIFYCH